MRAKLRSVLVALCVGVGIVLLAALAAVLVALIGGSGLVGGMNAARSTLLIAGGLAMLLGALGILAPRHFSGVGDRLGRGLRSRFGSSDATGAVVRGRGLPWYVVAVLAGIVVEVFAICVDYMLIYGA